MDEGAAGDARKRCLEGVCTVYNDMMVVWRHCSRTLRFQMRPRSVVERTKLFRKINWGVRLRQRIDQVATMQRPCVPTGTDQDEFAGYFDRNEDLLLKPA
jgi:hypothetical protein